MWMLEHGLQLGLGWCPDVPGSFCRMDPMGIAMYCLVWLPRLPADLMQPEKPRKGVRNRQVAW